MKTLRINPFHLRPVIKRTLHKPVEVEIPPIMNLNLYDKLLSMQGSLNYMATNYGVKFQFEQIPLDNEVLIKCCTNKNKTERNCLVSKHDDIADVVRKIYKEVSKVL